MFNLDGKTFRSLVGLSRAVVTRFVRDYLETKQQQRGPPTHLQPLDEILLGIIFFRHHLVDILLGAVFSVSARTATNVRERITDFFYLHLREKLTWTTPEERAAQGKVVLQYFVTWIVDGSEQPVLNSDLITRDAEFYSKKKKQHSINVLMVIDMTGRFLYLSPSMPGSSNDAMMSTATEDEWLGVLEDEWGLADSGFRGLIDKGYKVFTPPTKRNALYNLHSSFRVLVEQRFAALKQWRACRDPLRISPTNRTALLAHDHKIWTIVAVLLNDYQ